MSRSDLMVVAEVVVEARRLNQEMSRTLDELDAVIERALALGTDEIARLKEAADA